MTVQALCTVNRLHAPAVPLISTHPAAFFAVIPRLAMDCSLVLCCSLETKPYEPADDNSKYGAGSPALPLRPGLLFNSQTSKGRTSVTWEGGS